MVLIDWPEDKVREGDSDRGLPRLAQGTGQA